MSLLSVGVGKFAFSARTVSNLGLNLVSWMDLIVLKQWKKKGSCGD